MSLPTGILEIKPQQALKQRITEYLTELTHETSEHKKVHELTNPCTFFMFYKRKLSNQGQITGFYYFISVKEEGSYFPNINALRC